MNNLCNNTKKIYEINYFIFVNFFLYFQKKLLKNDKNISYIFNFFFILNKFLYKYLIYLYKILIFIKS